jgi:hypothetical protein
MESLGLSPAEVAIFADVDPLANDKWHGLYGFTSVRPAIQNPANTGNATLSITNADALTLRAGLAYRAGQARQHSHLKACGLQRPMPETSSSVMRREC